LCIISGVAFIVFVSIVFTLAGKFFRCNQAKFMVTMTLSYSATEIIAPVFTEYMLWLM
jgi:hypothetical protein